MKKITFILAVLFAANLATAQITLEHTFNGNVQPQTYSFPDFENTYFIQQNTADKKVTIYNADFTIYKTTSISLPEGYNFNTIVLSLYNVFCPNKLGFVVAALKSGNYNTQFWYGIFDEDGVLIKDLGYAYSNSFMLCENNSTFYLLVCKMLINTTDYTTSYEKTDVYSLPGGGEPQSLNGPHHQKHFARKVIHDNQMLIKTETNAYTLRGEEITIP